MVRTCALAFAVIALACMELGCDVEELGLAKSVRSRCESTQETPYFDAVFRQNEDGRAIASHLSSVLGAMGEPRLSCGDSVDVAYRFTVANTNSTAIAIRVESSDAGSFLSVARIELESRKIRIDRRPITVDELNEIRQSVNTFNFWNRPSYPSPNAIDQGVILLHAGSWIFEGRSDDWYHAITRGPTARERQFGLIAQRMYKLAGLEVPAEFNIPQL